MELEELIKKLPKLNKNHLNCFWCAYKNEWVEDTPELLDLIEKGFLKISPNKDISRIEGYFLKNNIVKIKDKKEFIFKYLPSTKGLENGKKAAYDELLPYIQKHHTYCFEEFLTDFHNYTFGDIVENNGYELLHHVAEMVDYTFAYNLETWHIIKNAEVSFTNKQTKAQRIIKFLKMFIAIPPFIENFILKMLNKRG